jgi:hypothetical protein
MGAAAVAYVAACFAAQAFGWRVSAEQLRRENMAKREALAKTDAFK